MKYFNYFLTLLGAIIALYANNSKTQNVYLLIIGIIVLMLGIYRISATIPSKKNNNEFDNTTD